MKKTVICLAILTMMSAAVSCGNTGNNGTLENSQKTTTSSAVTTAAPEASKAEKTTAANVSAKSETENKAKDTEQNAPTFNESDRLFGGYVATQGDDLNLRNEPFPTADIIDTIPNGTQIDIYSCGRAGWYCTVFKGKSGYVSADYIKEIESYDAGTETANIYGYYPVTEQPRTSIAVSDLEGTWTCGDDTITFHDCSWNAGKFEMKTTYYDIQGNVLLEYTLTPDNMEEMWYTLYNKEGAFVTAFHAESGIQLTDIYAGQSGDPHYTRK